ncbi:MAG: SGNH/GDSL hydrolase family protein [Verrucomicrobia bacterium]|nr:SGNH/GDSL hydrolase family protein [Verrucomicrobiota bacterium]
MKPLALLLSLAILAGCSANHLAQPSAGAAHFSIARHESRPAGPHFANFHPLRAPRPRGLILQPGDRLAICGDSITEQRMYSRIMETYLTVAVPELHIDVRQYGWSGETAPGFLHRLTNDCLRFHPTIATTCYGMNDHRYQAYTPEIGAQYRQAMTAIVESFKNAGARVVLGSPGCVGKTPRWARDPSVNPELLNLNLCELRNLDVLLARQEGVRFADVFWPMYVEGYVAQQRYGTNYALAGKDGVHPDWAGHLVMAYAFLHAFGLDGDIGTFTVDLRRGWAQVSPGHELLGFTHGELQVRSRRYPFCAPAGDPSQPNNLRSGMALVPFNRELNRLMLVVKHPAARLYRVTWGATTRSFTAHQLAKGVNLAVDFPTNPFSEAFERVDTAVAAKQAFETKQIKQLFHGEAGRRDMASTVASSEKDRAQLVTAIQDAFVPVTHTIRIEPE